MVAMHIRSDEYMAPERYLIRLDIEGEPPNVMLRRLREERGWTQYDLAARIDPERANDAQAIRNLQTLLSRYETGKITRPDDMLLEKLERVYGLEPNSLFVSWSQTTRARKRHGTLFPVDTNDVDALRQFARFLEESSKVPGAPSFEERLKGYARHLEERKT